MSSLSPKILRDLRRLVDPMCDGLTHLPHATLLAAIERALEPRRSVKIARHRKIAKRETRREKVAALRAEVMKRADGSCECCGMFGDLQMDHFFCGKNRRALENVRSCWMLCATCHHAKTNNLPTSIYWNSCFIQHVTSHYGWCPEYKLADRDSDVVSLKKSQKFGVKR